MIREIIIYPVKSMGGSSKNTWYATQIGFEYDRNWMLIDRDNKMITQRTHPELAKFNSDVLDGIAKVQKDDQYISWETNEYVGNKINSAVFDDPALVIEANKNVSIFVSDYLHQKVKLVKQESKNARFHRVAHWNENIPVSLADGYPYLIVGTKSLEFLNQQLKNPILSNRFRPNLIVYTFKAHEEDDYQKIHIGNGSFQNVKPCARCKIITIDQATGIASKEPLTSLNKYRQKDNKIYFGSNMTCLKEGFISVGDEVKHEEMVSGK
ncbi:MAG: MOSC N-terminal beta barrel domain-containing protein [Saprospiraceae bacterium]